jgi:hypothetical protein
MFHWPSLVFDPRHLQFLVTVSQFRILLFLPIFMYIRNEWPYLEYVRPPGRFIFGSCYFSVDLRLTLSNPYLEYSQPYGWPVLGNCVVTRSRTSLHFSWFILWNFLMVLTIFSQSYHSHFYSPDCVTIWSLQFYSIFSDFGFLQSKSLRSFGLRPGLRLVFLPNIYRVLST